MKIVLASNNKGKITEFKKLLKGVDVVAYCEILGSYEVIEDGKTFKQNAIKKAKEIYEKIADDEIIVISDDSGISVPLLGNEPGIYSARYAKVGASDKQNNKKLIEKLNDLGVERTAAYYTACICIVYKNEVFTVHGWMYGEVINKEIGSGGFGYDPMFIEKNQTQTLGELGYEIKKEFSHRTKALGLAKKILDLIHK